MTQGGGSVIVSKRGSYGNGVIWGLGDSITNNGRTVTTDGTVYLAQHYLMWACLLSGGKLRYGGAAATGGYTTRQVIDTHLQTVLFARPKFCVVHCGTNDIGVYSTAQTITNLTTIFESLISAGITPIATTMLPKHTLTSSSAAPLQTMSTFVQSYAQQRGFPCIDWRRRFIASSGDWTGYAVPGTYNADDTHPNEAGAQIMGQAIVDALGALVPNEPQYLESASVNSTALAPTSSNALLLTDTNSDGIPDAFATSGTVPGGSTFALTSMGSDGLGNWFTITRPAGGTDLTVLSTSQTIVPGHTMYVAMKLKSQDQIANTASFDVRYTDSSQAHDMFGLKTWKRDIAPSSPAVLAGTFVVPSGVTTGQLRILLRTAAQSVSLGQVTIIDLTTNGLAS